MIFDYGKRTVLGYDFGYQYEIRKPLSIGFNFNIGSGLSVSMSIVCISFRLYICPSNGI